MNNVASPTLTVRRITTADNAAIARVIRQVSAEYGLTADKVIPLPTPIWMNCIRFIANRARPTGW